MVDPMGQGTRKRTGKGTPSGAPKVKYVDLTPEQAEAFLGRLEQALPPEDFEVAKAMAATLTCMALVLKEKRASILRLRAMIFGSRSEKTAKVCPAKVDPGGASAKPKPKQPGHGRHGAAAFPSATKVAVPHPALKAGDNCPECPKGMLYPLREPAVMVRIVGLSPLQATVVERERLRCNACGEVFTAPAPEGLGPEKYDETAGAMVALLKYGTGLPFHRFERMLTHLGLPMPASTQWELVERAALRVSPVFDELMRLAAQGTVLHNDDTTMKVLDRPDLKVKDRPTRTGVYTSGIVSKVEGRRIALFLTGLKHAGENLADLLKHRSERLAQPIQMCDALAANTVGDLKTIVAHCLAHARRRFVDVGDNFPEECRRILEALQEVYRHEAEARGMPPDERLRFHQTRSGPVMEELRIWMTDQLEGRKTEPRSGLGTAILYMLKHWEELTLFLREPGAPLDNNLCERALKRAILHRKNSLFYKTLNGARVGDLYMSLIHTSELNRVNPFDYLVELQRNAALVEENPEEWMPWNYQSTLAALPE